MGYTHYWYRGKVISEQSWKGIMDDFKNIYNSLNTFIPLANGNGKGKASIKDKLICFNRKEAYEVKKNERNNIIIETRI